MKNWFLKGLMLSVLLGAASVVEANYGDTSRGVRDDSISSRELSDDFQRKSGVTTKTRKLEEDRAAIADADAKVREEERELAIAKEIAVDAREQLAEDKAVSVHEPIAKQIGPGYADETVDCSKFMKITKCNNGILNDYGCIWRKGYKDGSSVACTCRYGSDTDLSIHPQKGCRIAKKK